MERAVFIRWAVMGAVVATILISAQSLAVGGAAGLLQVGEASAVRPIIEKELGQVPLSEGSGHDGQTFYAIGLDLRGDVVPELLDHGAYRYRRILFPLVASAGGLLDGTALLYSMIIFSVFAFAAASGATAALGSRLGLTEWAGLAVVLNPGVWISSRLLTGDTMAIALMAVGLLLVLTRPRWAAASFALSVLTKDVYLATPVGLSVTRDTRRWVLATSSIVVLFGWMTWLTFTMGDGYTGRGNLALPFAGLIDASSNWANLDAANWGYLIFAMASAAVGLVIGLSRRGWLRWPILMWSVLAIVSSHWVWDFGNNAARAFAPIAVLVTLGFGRHQQEMA